MKNENHFPTDQLIRNTISAFKNGYIGEEQALSAIDFAAKLGDESAQSLLEECKKSSVSEAFDSYGK